MCEGKGEGRTGEAVVNAVGGGKDKGGRRRGRGKKGGSETREKKVIRAETEGIFEELRAAKGAGRGGKGRSARAKVTHERPDNKKRRWRRTTQRETHRETGRQRGRDSIGEDIFFF